MKIVQALGWYFPESVGGTEVYVAALSRRLRAAGCDVAIAAPDPGASRERAYEHDGIPVYRYPIAAPATRDEAQGLVPARGAARFHDWLASRRPEVVHVHSLVTGLGLHEVRAARVAGARRLLVTAHSGSLGWTCQRGTMMRWGRTPCDGVCRPAKCAACALAGRGVPRPAAECLGAIPPALGRLARRLPGPTGTALAMTDLIARNQRAQRELLEAVDRLVVLTDRALDALLKNGAPREKLALNRLGVERDGAPPPKLGPDPRPTAPPITVGYLGRLDPIKGVHDLVRAVRSLPRDAAIAVELRGSAQTAAERECARQLRALAADDPRLRLRPPVPRASVPEVLTGWDALCCPSVCLEGGPTVAIEAHAAGTPVIGTAIGGLAELVTDGVDGRLVPPGDWRALAGVLLEMARDPRGTIDRWRRALPAARTMALVADDYRALYEA